MSVVESSPAPACPACGSRETALAFEGTDGLLRAVSGTFPYRRCLPCASVFADPQPDDETLQAAYPTHYGNYDDRRTLVERLAEPFTRREARRVAARAQAGTPILEVGCGTGRFLERLQAVGWTGELRGVEYAADVAASTAARTGFNVDAGSAEDVDLGSGELGVIALRHVIEHLRDPGSFLERARAALAPEAVLYIATPDTRALSARAFGRHWVGYDPPRHLVTFSRDGMHALLAAHGFAVVEEWWNYAPQMWNGSLELKLGTPWARRATHLLNPLVSGPAAVLGAAELLTHRSTMYSLLARVAEGR